MSVIYELKGKFFFCYRGYFFFILILSSFQTKMIKQMCPVDVVGYSSEDNVDYWDKDKWDSELAKYQVLKNNFKKVMTRSFFHKYIVQY